VAARDKSTELSADHSIIRNLDANDDHVRRSEVLDPNKSHLGGGDTEQAAESRAKAHGAVVDTRGASEEKGVHTLNRFVAEHLKVPVAEESHGLIACEFHVALVEEGAHVDVLASEVARVSDEVRADGADLAVDLVDDDGGHDVDSAQVLFHS